MKLQEIYKEELGDSKTNYFIIDSGKDPKDVDFKSYVWNRSINNKMSKGDLFIYRKTKSVTGRNEFMLSGAGKVGDISGETNVEAKIEKPNQFLEPIFQHSLENYRWVWKEKGATWEHFWNQYGINQIPKEDFLNLLFMAEGDYNQELNILSVTQDIEIANEDYFVPDSQTISPSRPWQAAWSRRVKEVYGYKCSVCGLSEPNFLVSSHIIPVRDKDYQYTRKDPANGICLCTMHDRAFDGGYLTIRDDFTILVSKKAKSDEILWGHLSEYNGKSIKKPMRFIPKIEYLQYHYDFIFLNKLLVFKHYFL